MTKNDTIGWTKCSNEINELIARDFIDRSNILYQAREIKDKPKKIIVEL